MEIDSMTIPFEERRWPHWLVWRRFTCNICLTKISNSFKSCFNFWYQIFLWIFFFFLAQLSRRLKWAIVIADRPSSVLVVRKLFTFSTSSPEPLDGFRWNLVEMKYWWSLTIVIIFGQIRPGVDPGRAENRSRGPLLQETSSSDQKATTTNRFHGQGSEVKVTIIQIQNLCQVQNC